MPDKGIEAIHSAVQMAENRRHMATVFLYLPLLWEGYFLAGQYEKVRQKTEELIELAERFGTRGYLGNGHRVLGEVALKTNPDEAASHFEQAISIFREIKAENDLALAYSGMGRYHKQQGNTEQARENLTKALEIFERIGTLIEPDKVRKDLAELPG